MNTPIKLGAAAALAFAVDGKPCEVIDTPPNDRMKDFLKHV